MIRQACVERPLDYCCPGVHIDRISDSLFAVKNGTEKAVRIPAEGFWCGQLGTNPEQTKGEILLNAYSAEIYRRTV